MNPQIKQNFLSIKAKSEKKLLAACPVTGIILELELPSCLAVLDYRNPLADLKNILNLISTDKDLENFPNEIIAGMLLSLLRKKKLLIESKLSATEENLLLQRVAKSVLIDFISLASRITTERGLTLPKISLESQLLQDESKTFDLNLVIINHIKIIKSSIFGELYLDSSRTTVLTSFNSSSTKSSTTKAKSAITSELKVELKELLEELIEEGIASDKVIKVLKIALAGTNLLNLLQNDGIGAKLIAVLYSYDSEVATELADKLTKIQKELTVRDKAEQLFSKDLDRVSDSSISKPKKSLKEILAERLNPKRVEATDAEVEALERIIDSSEESEESEEALTDNEEALFEEEEKDTSDEF